MSSLAALIFGQPGFFAPRSMLDWISFANLTSYYNTDSLKSTLERLVDFDRINAKMMRFSVGAVNVRTGSLTFLACGGQCLLAAGGRTSPSTTPLPPAVNNNGLTAMNIGERVASWEICASGNISREWYSFGRGQPFHEARSTAILSRCCASGKRPLAAPKLSIM